MLSAVARISLWRFGEEGGAEGRYWANHSCSRASVRVMRSSGFSSRRRWTKWRPRRVVVLVREQTNRESACGHTFFAHALLDEGFPFDFTLKDLYFNVRGIAGLDERARARHPKNR